MNIDLSTILHWMDIKSDNLDINVSGFCFDSRKLKFGDIFVALSGNDNHGIDFAYQVQRAGASAIITEPVKENMAKPKSRQQPLTIPVIEIDDLSNKLGLIASNFYQNPSSKLDIIGITGTNGKTSCAWLLLQAWDLLGLKGAYIGTLGYGTIQQINDQVNTTPPATELQRILASFVDQGISNVSLEVSSHGLTLGRVKSTQFKGAGFTNISRDHLDFHKTIENYANSKKSLFTDYDLDYSIININDYHGKKWLSDINSNVISYGIDNDAAKINATDIKLNPQGISFKLNYHDKTYNIKTPLLGKFNVDNLLLVIATLIQQNIEIKQIVDLIPSLLPVPGRMNRVSNQNYNNPLIIVDYAHTPDALEQVLLALKQHNSRKIWCIFGCGGNRDKGKRPQMGHIAETLADHVIVTDDNPRYEENTQITNDILMGMNSTPIVINSRKDAIYHAIKNSHSNDLILIAGKGHETYQLIEGNYLPFDDRVIAAELLTELKEKCA